MSYEWLIPFFIIGTYLAVVAGLYVQATDVERLNPARRDVWKVPFIYAASIIYAFRKKERRIAVFFLLHPNATFFLILMCMADSK